VNDDLPYFARTEAGDIVSVPFNHELSDRQIIGVTQQSATSFVQQVEDAFAWLSAESQRFGGRMLPLTLTPYIIGLPYRIAAFEGLLANLKSEPSAWFASAGEIVDSWRTQAA
jgi:hypothetical protein